VELTAPGRAAMDAMFTLFTADIDAAVQFANPDDVTEFTAVLKRIASRLRDRATHPETIAAALARQSHDNRPS
jgi:hypothetical protein